MSAESSTLPPPESSNEAREVKEEELDATIEADITTDGPTQPDPMNLDGANEMEPANQNGVNAAGPALEARIPAKKDASLREFLGKMDDYAPIIPDAVTNYYLTLAGLPPPPQTPPHLARLLALATQKFIADIAADAYQYSRIRSSNTTSNNPMGGLGGAAGLGVGGAPGAGAAGGAAGADKSAQGKSMNLGVQRPGYGGGGQGGSQHRTVLTMEDLGMAVGEYGVNVKRGEFYR
ncbi:transcription initiation factor IID, TAF10 subunit [Saccharata proteae CBS 121410]|uniref:Transcription initiation factor TFIID subunit 10 n=1 Tax=Saccharata proteae CBS 121410 TaxID=1314787 RepID=A0A6A5YB14_9PEZI|nr:transcription initiation factor IID, TAF10 subunit [Saccharata proteae CBS 121410]